MSYSLISDLFMQNDVQYHIDTYIKNKFGLYFAIVSLLVLSTYTYSLLKHYKNELTLDIIYYTLRNILITCLFCILCAYHTYIDLLLPLSIRKGLGYLTLVSIVVGIYQSRSLISFWTCFVIKNVWILFILSINISLFGYIVS